MRPDRKLHDALQRLPPLLQILLSLWLGLGGLFLFIDELNDNLPIWFVIFLAAPWVIVTAYLSLSMDWMGARSIAAAFRKPEVSNEVEPADQYRSGEISYAHMMKLYEEREWRSLGDISGCGLIFVVVVFAVVSVVGLLPRHPDNSMKAEFVTPALALVGLASAVLLWRGLARRALKLACFTFLAIAAVGVPVGLVVIVGR